MPNTLIVRYTYLVTKKPKQKALFVFKKDGQDWGPFTLAELVEVALDGSLDPDTDIKNILNKHQQKAGSIKEIARAIQKYHKNQAHQQEIQQVEADVVRLEKGSSRRKWGPMLIIVVVLAIAGAAAWSFFVPKPRDKKFVPRLLFKDIDLPKLTPLSSSGIIHAHAKKHHKIHHLKYYSHKIHLIHKFEATSNMDFSDSDTKKYDGLTSATMLLMKKRLGQLISQCARSEIKRNSVFHDAQTGFLLKNSGSTALTFIKSQSGITKTFIQCVKNGAVRIHFTPYSGTPKVIIIPITRR